MNASDRHTLNSALTRTFGRDAACGCDAATEQALERLVGAGAGRLGLRADRLPNDPVAVNACLLAPPIARLIDHTVLKPETTADTIRELCAEAREHCFASVCVSPVWVPLAAEMLSGATSLVCTVIGFPHGANRTPVKAFETEVAVRDGASEIDMVIGRVRGEKDFADRVYDIWQQATSATERKQGFAKLATQLKRSKTQYKTTQELDEKLFGENYEL